MKKQIIAAVLVAMLGLTACDESEKSDNKTEKTTEATTIAETTEAAKDEVTEAISEVTTTEEITTEAEKKSAVPTGLSEKYADLDNRSFKYNGHLLTLGISTLQDVLDAGIEFESTDNYDKICESDIFYYDEDEHEWFDDMFDGEWENDFDYKTKDKCATLYFANPYINEIAMKDCVLVQAWYFCNEGTQESHEKYEFAFPTSLTKEELSSNSGEPTAQGTYDNVEYTKVSDLYPEADSGYDFRFNGDDGKLGTVIMTWIP